MLPVESPRVRRRLLRLGAVAAVCGIAAVVFLLLPNTNGHVKETFSNAPPQLVVRERQVPVTPARRAEVNRLFDVFVPAAVERRDPGAAGDPVPEGEGRADVGHHPCLLLVDRRRAALLLRVSVVLGPSRPEAGCPGLDAAAAAPQARVAQAPRTGSAASA